MAYKGEYRISAGESADLADQNNSLNWGIGSLIDNFLSCVMRILAA